MNSQQQSVPLAWWSTHSPEETNSSRVCRGLGNSNSSIREPWTRRVKDFVLSKWTEQSSIHYDGGHGRNGFVERQSSVWGKDLGEMPRGQLALERGLAAERSGISSGKVSLVEVDVKRLRDCNVPVQGARKDWASKETCPPGQPTSHGAETGYRCISLLQEGRPLHHLT